jgi:hypothetical protein
MKNKTTVTDAVGIKDSGSHAANVSESAVNELVSWDQYPLGTKAHAVGGGCWERVERGWKWCTGATFPTPGGDAFRVELPSS